MSNIKSTSLTTKENLKLKLKSMRLRIKKKREEFLRFGLSPKVNNSNQMSNSTFSNQEYMEQIRPEIENYSLFDGIIPKKNVHPIPVQKNNSNTIISVVDITFDKYVIDLNHISKTNLSNQPQQTQSINNGINSA